MLYENRFDESLRLDSHKKHEKSPKRFFVHFCVFCGYYLEGIAFVIAERVGGDSARRGE